MVHRGMQKHQRTSSNGSQRHAKTSENIKQPSGNWKKKPSSENLNKYEQQRATTQYTIEEAKRSSWRTFTSKINSYTNPRIICDFMKKITNKKKQPCKSSLSRKCHKWKTYCQPDYRKFGSSVSYKNYLNIFNSIRIKEDKNIIKFTSDNIEL